jgi:hypothetical protein
MPVSTYRKKRKHSHSQKGGDSAWQWQLNNLGNGWTQFMNSLSLQSGENLGTIQSNAIVPVNNINAEDSQVAQNGGRRRRNKKGGNWGAVVEQAAVPLALLGMQQMYGKNRTRKSQLFKRKTRRHRR